jgi:hypothetical protein
MTRRGALAGEATATRIPVGATNDRLSQHHLRIDFDPILRLFDLASEPDGHSVDYRPLPSEAEVT